MKLNQLDEVILVINAGSSSIKFSLFISSLTLIYHGEIESIFDNPQITVSNAKHEQIVKKSISSSGYESLLSYLFEWIAHLPTHYILKAVGHRVVHGGRFFDRPILINPDSIKKLSSLNPLAPLHQPHNVAIIESILKRYPDLLQVACFDTSFHQTQDKLATLFAIPRELSEEGIVRYGFHGISYEYIASVLPEPIKNKKVIVAHLGNGASMCAMEHAKSVTTSMGFTALDGLMMGTRCGVIDPGVILYLLQEKKLSVEEVNTILYKKSGLLGVSGISGDMRELQSSKETNAVEAIELFCYRAARELCALASSLQGCDAIIFTAGIGEHSAPVRKKICERLVWLGVMLDESANMRNAAVISHTQSRVFVGVIPTNEEYMIAKHTLNVVLDT
ncbi:Acetate kinase (Acetokinase) [Legionella steigerwaltii]|uniref:Acetate kinase n=1 Tax=Legionella steigerwaltii TaxID=460 RepID=A0A378LG95_9GAMM|nr:acetate/propionate family kinase [Legionella steigerwaltii]KTD80079.1 Acetate kinase (Acetokinase) [Legionella steigerwaltii]STY23101.1 Acetate kinase (Acetokinase) [Legionella steigerwaltii]